MTRPEEIALPPRCAANFRAERLLASGGFGFAILAQQVSLGRRAVVKVLSTAAPDEGERTRFRREARITASLNHPGIVKVFDHDVEGDTPWIAYEYVEGATLGDEIAAGRLSPDAVRELGRAIAAALAAGHEQGVLHRDVKPANLVHAKDGRWVLIDFGISKWSGTTSVQTETGVILGTPEYMPPEYIRGEPFTPAGDLYALGAVLYHAATGRTPFRAAKAIELLQEHLNAPPPRIADTVADFPPELAALIESTLAKAPKSRPESAAALARAFAELTVGASVLRKRSAVLARTMVRERAPLAPLPRRAWVAPLCTAILLAGGAALLAFRPVAPPPVAAPGAPTWDTEHRAVVLPLPEDAHGLVRATAPDHPTVEASISPGARAVALPDLDADTSYTIELSNHSAITVRTPPLCWVSRVDSFPADTWVMVDFNYAGPATPRVSVQRADGQGPEIPVKGETGPHWFHGEARGLAPETYYRVFVRHPDAFGGVAGDPFRTAPAAAPKSLQALNDAIRSPEEAALQGLALAGATQERDPRHATRMRALLATLKSVSPETLAEWVDALGQYRDHDAMVRVLPDPEPFLRAQNLHAALKLNTALHRARHPKAPLLLLTPLADGFLSAAGVNFFDAFADVLRWRPSASVADGLARVVEQDYGSGLTVQAMAAHDPVAARGHFERWLAGPSTRRSDAALFARAAHGLSQDDDARSAGVLARHARTPGAPHRAAIAIAALSRMSSKVARDAVDESIRSDALTRDQIWAALRSRRTSIVPKLKSRLSKPSHPQAQYIAGSISELVGAEFTSVQRETCDALVALAVLAPRDPAVPELMMQHVGDPALNVAGAAAWALGEIRYQPAVGPIVERLLARDTSGAALWALGQLRDPLTLPKIEAVIASPGTDRLASTRQQIAIIARARIRGEPERSGRRFALFPFMPLLPTGLSPRPEQAVLVRVDGKFGLTDANGQTTYTYPVDFTMGPHVGLMRGPVWIDLRRNVKTSGLIDHPAIDGRHELVFYSRPSVVPLAEPHEGERYSGAALIEITLDPQVDAPGK